MTRGEHHETYAAGHKKYSKEEETEVELVGLGLPLQGPGWTEYARVRECVGVQVKRGRHCVHVAP